MTTKIQMTNELLDTVTGTGTLDLVAEGLAPDPALCGKPVALLSSRPGVVRFCLLAKHDKDVLHQTNNELGRPVRFRDREEKK